MTTMTRYQPLDDAEVARALAELPRWHGDCSCLSRTVRPQDLWALLERVAAVETELDHHTVVDLDAGTVTFRVWSHVCGAVTPADLELARRLEDVLGSA